MSQARKSLRERYLDVMPTGAGTLCIIQIFATLSYSVLYSTLVLYATKGLGLSDMLATSITGSALALNYFLHLLGGYIGGRYLSYRSLFSIGMVFQFAGCLLIAIPHVNFLLWGLAVFLGGSGINVTCINCMVTQLFDPTDKRRESAFLWNYSGMNIGFFVGFLISGKYFLTNDFVKLFVLSGFGNLTALIWTLLNWKLLDDRDTTFVRANSKTKKRNRILGLGILFALILSLRLLLKNPALCNQIINAIGLLMLVAMIFLATQQHSREENNKIWAFIILGLSSLIFWTLYQLAPMGLNLFIERNVNRHVWGIEIAPQWVQNINTIVIILGGPLFSAIFSRLRERGINITISLQFAIALVLIGIGFAILPIGIHLADARGYSDFSWVFVSYLLQSLGELFISPIGYAAVGQLAPKDWRGFMMGVWMMITGIAITLSDYFSKVALGNTTSTDPLITNSSYSHTFGWLGWGSIAVGLLVLLMMRMINRLTQENRK